MSLPTSSRTKCPQSSPSRISVAESSHDDKARYTQARFLQCSFLSCDVRVLLSAIPRTLTSFPAEPIDDRFVVQPCVPLRIAVKRRAFIIDRHGKVFMPQTVIIKPAFIVGCVDSQIPSPIRARPNEISATAIGRCDTDQFPVAGSIVFIHCFRYVRCFRRPTFATRAAKLSRVQQVPSGCTDIIVVHM